MEIGRDTRAIVSGATRGIGRSTARALGERGALVGLLARSEDQIEELAVELPRASALPADVGDASAVERAVEDFTGEAGGLELVVANAAIAHRPLRRARG